MAHLAFFTPDSTSPLALGLRLELYPKLIPLALHQLVSPLLDSLYWGPLLAKMVYRVPENFQDYSSSAWVMALVLVLGSLLVQVKPELWFTTMM